MRAAEAGGKREEDPGHKELPTQARDAYLLFQVRTLDTVNYGRALSMVRQR